MVFHHDTHTHPFMPATTGATNGTFTSPALGETATNVWYRIHLQVRDSAGLVTASSVDVRPQVADLTLETDPAGLQVTLDGQPVAGGTTVSSVVGMVRTIGVVSPQTVGEKRYEFQSWSDGGAATHDVVIPAEGASQVAVFSEIPAEEAPASPGLMGEYFDNVDFTGPKVTRFDPAIDFTWRTAAPDPSMGVDTFSVRWTGNVTPTTTEAYTFTTRADDGIRLFLDGRLLIDNWRDQSATDRSATVPLVAGRPYALRVEYYEHGVDATARLYWEASTVARQIIPRERLSTGTAPVLQPPTTSVIRINFQPAGAETPAGYRADTGGVFGDRDGLSYGWNVDHSSYSRDRQINPDQAVDTFCYFHNGGVWQVALANGTYQVTVSVGDARDQSYNTVNVEGVNYFNQTGVAANQFAKVTKSVTVSDGRLNIDAGQWGEKVSRINFVEIQP